MSSTYGHLIAVAVLCAAAHPAWSNDKPLLDDSTEALSPDEIRPPPQLVRAALECIDKDGVKGLDQCLAGKGLKRGDYASLLLAKRISAGADHNLWFLRPTLDPYCQALYGAHAFQYFFLEEQLSGSRQVYRLLFQNDGDKFVIYARKSHGLNDIEATGCIAVECRSARMSYDGRKYWVVRCAQETFTESGQEVEKPRRRGSDDWRDD
jgi:hypothetical protein